MATKFGKAAALLTAFALTASVGTATAMAADNSSYSYLTGRQQNSSRHAQFEKAGTLTDDAAREAYFEEQGIGGDGAFHDGQHLDAEKLVEAGVIDAETAERIVEYAAEKHASIHTRMESKSGMTPQERRSFYESFEIGRAHV